MHHVVEAIHIVDAPYFPDLRVDLAPGLNCIIAEHGAGKTALLHIARFALGVAPPAVAAERTRYEGHIEATLGAGSATVHVRTAHGLRYTSTRTVGSRPSVADERGPREGVSLAGELFHSEFFGPGEIEGIATHAQALLALVDGFAQADLRRVSDEITQLERQLARNAEQLTRLHREIDEDEARARELPQIEEALKGLEQLDGPDPDAADRAREQKTLRGRERHALHELTEGLTRARALLDTVGRDAATVIERGLDRTLLDGPNADVFEQADATAAAAIRAVRDATARLQDRLTDAEQEVAEQARTLAGRHAPLDAAFHAQFAAAEEDLKRRAERERLRLRYDELLHARKRHDDRLREREGVRAERNQLLEHRRRAEAKRFEIRHGVVTRLQRDIGDPIRLTLQRAKDTRAYESLLLECVGKQYVRSEYVHDVAQHVPPEDLASMVWRGDPESLIPVDRAKTGRRARAEKLLEVLSASGRLTDIEAVSLGDVAALELKIGDDYRSSEAVSNGQSSTCVLPIILAQSEGPLFVDQPEENLDGRYIYKMLVQNLMRVKTSRQVVVVTHDPNIPVLGDADRVILLASDGRHGHVERSGSVDEMRTEIVDLMEGGFEAFTRRGERYDTR